MHWPREQDSFLTRRDAIGLGVLGLLGPALAWATRSTPPIATDVVIAEFDDTGKRIRTVSVAKVVKSDEEWRKQLSLLAFTVARRGGTERAFSGAYWNLHEHGFFRCVCCDTALFSTNVKFDSGTGWPSFWDMIADENIVTHKSRIIGNVDSELTCTRCDAHLGDVFDDGPPPTGLRYCIDSVSLKFVKTAK